jgi:hypothetical protein
MANRNKQRETSNPQPDAAAPSEPATNPSLVAMKERLAFMHQVQQVLKSTMGRPDIDHREKKSIVMDELTQLGASDDDIRYIFKKEKGVKDWYGFTFAEMNALEDQIDTEQMLSEKRAGTWVAREQARREAKGKVVDFNPDSF